MTVAPMPTLDRSRNRSHRKADIDAADVARNQADLFHFERIEPGRGGAKHVFAFSQLGKSVPCVVRFRFVLIVARHVSGFDLRAGAIEPCASVTAPVNPTVTTFFYLTARLFVGHTTRKNQSGIMNE